MQPRAFRICLCSLVLLVAGASYAIVSSLQYRFGGYDLSPLIDSGWRIVSGQTPNKDFICTFPPLLYLGAAMGFRLFGVHWRSLSLISVGYTATLTFLGMRVLLGLRERLERAPVVGLCYAFAALEFLPALMVGHPWHSSWTEDAALYALLSTFAVAFDGTGARGRELLLHLCLAETLLLLGKPNTGLPAIAVCAGVLLLRPGRQRTVLYPLAGALLLASACLSVVGTNLATTYTTYFQLSSRLGNDGGFKGLFSDPFVQGGLPDLAVYAAVFPALLCSLYLTFRAFCSRETAWLGVLASGSVLIAVLSLGTNVEFRLVDVGCIVLGAALLLSVVRTGGARVLAGVVAQAIFSLAVLGFFYLQTRTRMQAVGVWASNDCGAMERREDAFFGEFHGCDAFFSVLSAADAALKSYASERIFFGPRMEFLYARNRLQSPKGLPMWWHPGSSFPERNERGVVQAWERDHFDVLIFLHADRTRLPQAILDDIQQDYVEVPAETPADARADGRIDVLRRR